MNTTIDKVNRPTSRKDWSRSATRFTVYTDGVARDLADHVYLTKHALWNHNFRIPSWGRVAGVATKIEAAAAKAAVEARFPGVKVELKFSRTAGCGCGCSPGYVGKIVEGVSAVDADGNLLSRADLWASEVISFAEIATVKAAALKAAAKLPQEIAAGEAKLAAEAAAKEQERAERERQRWEAIDKEASLASAAL